MKNLLFKREDTYTLTIGDDTGCPKIFARSATRVPKMRMFFVIILKNPGLAGDDTACSLNIVFFLKML